MQKIILVLMLSALMFNTIGVKITLAETRDDIDADGVSELLTTTANDSGVSWSAEGSASR